MKSSSLAGGTRTALVPLAGETIYLVAHIPEARSGEGVIEFAEGDKAVHTPIAALNTAFAEAKVNLLVVGCVSALHAPLGFDRILNNVTALQSFLSALESSPYEQRSLLAWHASFGGSSAKLIVDPLQATLYEGPEETAGAPNRVILASNGTVVSNGFIGLHVPPPLPPGSALSPSVPLSVAARLLSAPDNGHGCVGDDIRAIDAASRLVPLATTFLIAIYLIVTSIWLFESPPEKFDDVTGVLFAPLLLALPLVWSRVLWGSCLFECRFEPGAWLPAWCALYSLLLLAVGGAKARSIGHDSWNSGAGLRAVLLLTSCALMVGTAALFIAAYLGIGAAEALRAYCDAFPTPR